MWPPDPAAAAAELIGTALFIFCSTGSAVGFAHAASAVLGTATAFGFSIVALAYASGDRSGGQFNPAVSVGLVAAGKLPAVQGVANIGCQIVGAVVGSGAVYAMHPNSSLGVNALAVHAVAGSAFLAEMIATFALVYVVLETCARKNVRESAPVAIGMAVFVSHLALIPYTSCSINPARALGPAIVSGTWGRSFWVFIVGPTVGGLLAAPAHMALDWLAPKAALPP